MSGWTVVWDGTDKAECGTPYLAADPVPTRPASSVSEAPTPTLRSRVHAVIEARGPSTIREIADVLGDDLYRINATVCNMRAAGQVVVVAMRPLVVRLFGVRHVAVYAAVAR